MRLFYLFWNTVYYLVKEKECQTCQICRTREFLWHYISWILWSRYNILGANALANAKNEKVAAKILFDIVGLETEKYRLGHTKVSIVVDRNKVDVGGFY